MSTLRESYRTLGLTPQASFDQVKRAYLKLAKQWHPDRFVSDPEKQHLAEEKFKTIVQAYEQLRAYLEDGVLPLKASRSAQAHSQISDDPEVFYQRAVEYVEDHNLEMAIEALTHAIRLDPEYIKAYQYRAFLNEQLGYEHRAASDFKKVQELKLRKVTVRSPSREQAKTRSRSTAPSQAKTSAEPTPGSQAATTSRSAPESPGGAQPQSTPTSTADPISEPSFPPLPSWELVRVLKGHTQTITGLTYSADGSLLVTGSPDRTIKLWPLDGGRVRYTLPGYEGPIHDLSLRRDGQAVVAACGDKVLRWWDLATRKMHRLGRVGVHTGPILCVAFSPDGEKVISGSVDKQAKIWQFSTGRLLTTLEDYSEPVSLISVSPTGSTLVTNGEGKVVRIRRLHDGGSLRWLTLDAPLLAAAFSPDGQQIATATRGHLLLWQVNSARVIHALSEIQGITAVAFSPRGDLLAAGGYDRRVRLWRVQTGTLTQTLPEFSARIVCLAWHPNAEELLCGCGDGSIQVLRPATRSES